MHPLFRLLLAALPCFVAQADGPLSRHEPLRIKWAVNTVANSGLRREYRVRTWTTGEGLPLNKVQCLLQTRDRFLWIGTQGGLARFDGQRFVTFNGANTPAFRTDSCLSLAEGPDNALWIGTTSGIVCYRSNRFERIEVSSWHPDTEWVTGIAATPSGKVWVATRQGPGTVQNGKFVPDESFATYMFGGQRMKETFAIAIDSRGAPIVTDKLGLSRRDPRSTTWERLSTHGGFQMFTSKEGAIWVVDPLLYRIDGQATQPVGMKDGNTGHFNAAAVNRAGRIYVSFANEVYRFDDQLNEFHRLPTFQKLPGGIKTMLVDLEENIWLGTANGLVCLTRNMFSSLTRNEGLVHQDVWSIVESTDGSIWIGTDGGVSRYRGGLIENYLPEPHPTLALRRMHDVLALRNGDVWSTPDGFLRRIFPFPQGVPLDPPEELRGIPIFEDRDGSVWIDESGYLKRLREGRIQKQFELGAGVYGILRDNAGRLWIGTRGKGLLMIDGSRTNRFTTASGLTSDFCGPALADAKGSVWIVSDKGLNRWRDGRFTRYTIQDGLPEGFILNILEDDFGWFWLNSHHGIYRVSAQELNDFAEGRIRRLSVEAYNEADGIPSAEGNGGFLPNSCKARDGTLWFPTIKGVAVAHPAEMRRDAPPAAAVISRVSANGKVIRESGAGLAGFRLPFRIRAGGAEVLDFDFTAPTFIPNPRLQFAYRLEPQDKSWTIAKQERSARYTNLRPGRYRFAVKTVGADRAESEPVIVAFSVAPHFYETWTFYLLSGALLLGLIASVHTQRLGVQRRIMALERQSALQEERARIAADIHDGLGGDFSRIAVLAERLQRDDRDKSAAASIAQTVRQMGENMSELIWATNSKNDALDNLLAYLREHAATMCDAAGVTLITDFQPIPSRQISGFLRHNVYLIFREALNNIVKHAGASEVRFRATCNGETLALELSDNGRGFPAVESGRRSYGQANLRKRAEDIHARIEVSSRSGIGTTILLSVPLTMRRFDQG